MKNNEFKTVEEIMDILNCSNSCTDKSVAACNECLESELYDSDDFRTCPSCDSPNFDQEGCFYVCSDCGVAEPVDDLDMGYFSSEDDALDDCED